MPAEQTLTDDQLIAVAQSGDSSLLRLLAPAERQRLIQLANQPSSQDVNQAGAEIEQNITRYRRLGVPTDELGRPTRPLTLSERFANAIQNPSPGAVLAGDLAGMAAGLAPKAVEIATPLATRTIDLASRVRINPSELLKVDVTRPATILRGAKDIITINPGPVTNAERAFAGTIGNQPMSDTTPSVSSARPDVWDNQLQQAAADRAAVIRTKALAAKTTNPRGTSADVSAVNAQTRAARASRFGTESPSVDSRISGLPPETAQSSGSPATPANPDAQPVSGSVTERAAQMRSEGITPPTNAEVAAKVAKRAATSPAETSSATARRRSSASPAAERATAKTAPAQRSAIEGFQAEGLSAAEADQAYRWLQQGIEPAQVVKRLNATRALLGAKPILNRLPSLQQALDEVRSR